MSRLALPERSHLATIAAGVVALVAAACNGGDVTPGLGDAGTGSSSSPAASGTSEPASTTPGSPTAVTGSGTATMTASATSASTPDSLGRLRRTLLSNLTIGLDPGSVRTALQAIEVETLEVATEDRDLWFAVTTGPGIYDLPEARDHVLGVYQRTGDDWVELASIVLGSAPTVAELEVVAASYEGATWVAVHGFTGAHSGTFELIRFDGTLTSAFWWFSSMPGAATVVDLDGTAPPEIVLNATDPYVYCYACGVRAWHEVIYRWQGGELVEVPLDGVAGNTQVTTDLSEVAAILARADLWRSAAAVANDALASDPDNVDLWWLHQLITRVAEQRLAEAGAEQQPFMTNVLAGEYAAAVDLMRPYVPEMALAPDGPLVADTVADGGWNDATALWVLDYTERAIAATPDLAAAHAVRAFGLLVADPENWAGALMEMETALRLAPNDAFYREAVDYLFARNGGAFG